MKPTPSFPGQKWKNDNDLTSMRLWYICIITWYMSKKNREIIHISQQKLKH